ncbi:hscarg dehydrogenase [Pochonia chlamydosporia 170]|uniref:Hscarg dehydrogenase n=1 Tax=Pochonia chlamydosporia 170 TaxID=1380566 RepID=A0A179EZ89_METCM|nr:hscarg dehydrogenase [Pochonia chlamydosporia 170]OAQ58514.1 hscarg dehydrogenase [Pochonia chlamydosporia 170]
MSQILTVFGSTGQQGGSVIDFVLNDPELYRRYKLRAITRNPDSEKSQQLKSRNIEVVRGDVTDRSSLNDALTGTHTVFLVTVPDFGPNALQTEFESAKNVVDLSLQKGVQHIIFSSLPSISDISGGRYTKVTMFDAKARVESYIRSLPIKSTFYSPGSFMDNYITVASPRKASDESNTYIMALHISPQTRVPLVDAGGDTGKFIGAILISPDKYNGQVICGADRLYSLEEIAHTIGRATGKDVVYRQISAEEYEASVPFGGDVLVQTMSYFEEFGYYGADTERLVASAARDTKGRLTTFEEFLTKRPLKLA